MVLAVNPNTVLIDPRTGKLTREGLLFFTEMIANLTFSGAIVGTTDSQTLTNKTIDGDLNTLQDIATSSLKTRTGTGTHVVTSDDSGVAGNLTRINADGDLVDSGIQYLDALTTSDIEQTVAPYLTGILGGSERSSDPGDPAEGQFVIWQSDGTGTGDDGDILLIVTAGGVTKTTTLVDFSAI